MPDELTSHHVYVTYICNSPLHLRLRSKRGFLRSCLWAKPLNVFLAFSIFTVWGLGEVLTTPHRKN
jgi:hypothetical protein